MTMFLQCYFALVVQLIRFLPNGPHLSSSYSQSLRGGYGSRIAVKLNYPFTMLLAAWRWWMRSRLPVGIAAIRVRV